MGVRLILGFSISFLLLIVSPALLPQELGQQPGMRLGDAVDLLTPFVLVSFYYWLFRSADEWVVEPPTALMTVLFVAGAILFIEGHGMHLAANSIGHSVYGNPANPAYAITYFYDEVLSHYTWHLGMLILATVLLWRHYSPAKKGLEIWSSSPRRRAVVAVAALLYGVSVALSAIEGQTVPLILPTSLLIALVFAAVWRRQRQMPCDPAFSFLGLGYTVAAAGLLSWGGYWGGFPEFSELGILG